MPAKSGRVQRRDPVEFRGVIPYKEDDYNIKEAILKKEINAHYKKIKVMHDSRPWYHEVHSGRHKDGALNKPKDVMGLDVELPKISSFEKIRKV